MNLRAGAFIGILTVLAMGLFYVSLHREPTAQGASPLKPKIDETMLNVRAQQFNQQGALSQILYIEKAYHYQGEKQMHFVQPRLTFFQPQTNWHIASQAGIGYQHKLGGHFHQLDLTEGVFLQGTEKNKTWHLTTSLLHIFPEEKLAKTLEPVKLEGTEYILNAKGMHINLTNRQVEFLSDVKSEYKPST